VDTTSAGDAYNDQDAHGLRRRLKRAVLLVAGLNLAYFFVEFTVALAIGSVSLFADSVDFLEDTAINLLIFLALGWSLHRQALAGKAMAIFILVPALAAAWQAFIKFTDPEPPDPFSLVVTAGGAVLVNLACSLVLARFRHHGGSMATAAFLSARNDVLVNLAIIAMGVLTLWTASGWPDLVLGSFIVLLNFRAAKEVWETAEEERLAAKALAGEEID
jgi:Co/Zn/Cd efflux system component